MTVEEWTVTVDLATPDPLDEGQLVSMGEMAADHRDAPVGSRGSEVPGFSLVVDLRGLQSMAALQDAVDIAVKPAQEVGAEAEVVGVEATGPRSPRSARSGRIPPSRWRRLTLRRCSVSHVSGCTSC
ncbi:MAG TPA: hypothetical protein VD813_08685 [Pseudonocardia sp.]|nr:hypothetical protein [Pseudonocardia sp.]